MLRRAEILAVACVGLAGCADDPVQPNDVPLTVGFVYVGSTDDNGWTYQHDQGRFAVEAEFGDRVATVFREHVSEADSEGVIEELVEAGSGLVFTTSFDFMEGTLSVAGRYPEVKFEHATGYMREVNVSTYSGRFYEGRYVLGQIAARMSENGLAGYIASIPIPEVDSRNQRLHARGAVSGPRLPDRNRVGQHVDRPGA